MEEHLQVAVHVASIPLIHQAIEIPAILLLPSQGQHNEDIRFRLGFEPNDLRECRALESSSAGLDDLCCDLGIAEP